MAEDRRVRERPDRRDPLDRTADLRDVQNMIDRVVKRNCQMSLRERPHGDQADREDQGRDISVHALFSCLPQG